jgi:hypothetical protein
MLAVPQGGPARLCESAREAHARLADAAARAGATDSRFVGCVSRHALPSTVSFATLAGLHHAVKLEAKRAAQCDYVAASGRTLVFSSRIGAVPSVETLPPAALVAGGGPANGRKRGREDDGALAPPPEKRAARRGASGGSGSAADSELRAAEAAVERVRAAAKAASVDAADVERAAGALFRVLADLRGAAGEAIVQSYAVLVKRISQFGYSGPVVVLALRCYSGIPIPVSDLKRALGPCWSDGIVTIERTYAPLGLEDADLPLTSEGQAAAELGNAPLLVVATAGGASRAPESAPGSAPEPAAAIGGGEAQAAAAAKK